MKHSKLKQIIKEEIRNVLNEVTDSEMDSAYGELYKRATGEERPTGPSKNKFREPKETPELKTFTVGYTWRNGEDYEDEVVTVKANTKEEAIVKAKEGAPRLARVNGKFEVIK